MQEGTPLQRCCEAGDIEEAVRLINDPETDVDVRISNGETEICFPRIFHWASEKGHVELLEALIARGVNIHKKVSPIIHLLEPDAVGKNGDGVSSSWLPSQKPD